MSDFPPGRPDVVTPDRNIVKRTPRPALSVKPGDTLTVPKIVESVTQTVTNITIRFTDGTSVTVASEDGIEVLE